MVKKSKKVNTITVRLAELTKPLTVSDIEEGTTLMEFLEENDIKFSASVRVNGEPAEKDDELEENDIITVIGQVSGGC